jgi:amino acid transporter
MGWIKIASVSTMILFCLVSSCGGNPRHESIGFRYWKDEAFRGLDDDATGSTARFLGFWSSTVQACFAYTGAEIVGVSFGEVKNPQEHIPKAIRLTAFRIISIYILGVLSITMSVSPKSPLLLSAIQEGKKSGGKRSTKSKFLQSNADEL